MLRQQFYGSTIVLRILLREIFQGFDEHPLSFDKARVRATLLLTSAWVRDRGNRKQLSHECPWVVNCVCMGFAKNPVWLLSSVAKAPMKFGALPQFAVQKKLPAP